MWECSSRSVQPRSKQSWRLTARMRQAVKFGKKPRRVKPSAANNLHQSRRIILYDIHLRPNSSNSSIEARPMIDIEPRRAFSLEMHPFEYGPVKYGITIKRGFQKQPTAPPGNVDSDRAFRASVVAKVASDRRIGFIEPTESGDLRPVRAAEVGESSRQLDISSRATDEIGIVGHQGRPEVNEVVWMIGVLRPHQPILMTMRPERGANYHGRRNEVFAHHNLGNLSGTKVARILVSRNHIQIDDCSHCAQG